MEMTLSVMWDLLTYCKWEGTLAVPLTFGNLIVYVYLETAEQET